MLIIPRHSTLALIRKPNGEGYDPTLGSDLVSQALWSVVWDESQEASNILQERSHVVVGVEHDNIRHQTEMRTH